MNRCVDSAAPEYNWIKLVLNIVGEQNFESVRNSEFVQKAR